MRQKVKAFTVVELIASLGALSLLAYFLLPSVTDCRARAERISCVNNLKMIGLAFRIFAHDHHELLPGQFYSTNGFPLTNLNAAQFFTLLSNELRSPKFLHSADDKDRQPAQSFDPLELANISYFASLTARQTVPQMFLAGDRHLQIDHQTPPPAFAIHSTDAPRYSWSSELHKNQGDIAMADGSVQQFSSSRLRQEIKNSEAIENWILRP